MLKIGLLLPQNYRLLSVAAILDVMDTVNGLYAAMDLPNPFELRMVTINNSQNRVSDHPHESVSEAGGFDLIFIPSFATADMQDSIYANREFLPWLQKNYAEGAEIATFCTGVFLLAATGLLDGKAATTHVDACTNFAKAFPSVKIKADKIVTHDGRLYTSGGATSTFHLLLYLLQIHCGKEVAVKTAKIFAIDMNRENQLYFSTFKPARLHNDALVASAQQKIESSFHDLATIEEMIKDIPSSRRNIVRRFKQVVGITPIEYLQQTRIEAAKRLLEQTGEQMSEVIYQSGYTDPKAFRKVFRKTVGMTPTQYREKFKQ
ncbi:GlxA family transcriptional regulator [Pedobacter sandarakinus]|uniref:GlxA family transcriptional regulator n=1 Tax=Pedobacter sandarakinus TaxID=353156 RepID=UPI002247C257|nr:helix-turn-helix domain-containing protein [Pedobacter sandarakinus]MCX2575284.1 helix-turn-helix domain-containing protein [Pedobacter sandarakinus]